MGDASDNIPGVKGIGEKTALKLLQEHKSLDGIYNNIDKITGKTKEKLENDKQNAYMSFELATIYKEVPLEFDIEDIKYRGYDTDKYVELLNELEFYSLLKKISIGKVENNVSNYVRSGALRRADDGPEVVAVGNLVTDDQERVLPAGGGKTEHVLDIGVIAHCADGDGPLMGVRPAHGIQLAPVAFDNADAPFAGQRRKIAQVPVALPRGKKKLVNRPPGAKRLGDRIAAFDLILLDSVSCFHSALPKNKIFQIKVQYNTRYRKWKDFFLHLCAISLHFSVDFLR